MSDLVLTRTDSSSADFRTLIKLLDDDLRGRNGDLMNVYDQHNIIEQLDTVVIAYAEGQPAGCGCFKAHNDEVVELKRMFVKPEFRGRKISAIILADLESWAHGLGYTQIVLETGHKQREAINLYTRSGFALIPNYGPYVDMDDSICFGKPLKAAE